jgi:hypothetical protein
VPIGQRTYDHAPISEVTIARLKKEEE